VNVLLVPAHPGFPGQIPQSRKTVVVVVVVVIHCCLGSSKGIWPVKKLSGGMLAWLYVWGKVQICL